MTILYDLRRLEVGATVSIMGWVQMERPKSLEPTSILPPYNRWDDVWLDPELKMTAMILGRQYTGSLNAWSLRLDLLLSDGRCCRRTFSERSPTSPGKQKSHSYWTERWCEVRALAPRVVPRSAPTV